MLQVVEEVAGNFGIGNFDALFSLEALDANAPEPFPSPISYRDAIGKYLDLDATPSPAALAVFAECVEEKDPDASDRLHRLAGVHSWPLLPSSAALRALPLAHVPRKLI